MKLIRANRRMVARHGDMIEAPPVPLPETLKTILSSGLVQVDGCVVLSALSNQAHVSPDDYPDKTGYEAFVNHVHIEESRAGEAVDIAVSFLREVSRLVSALYAGRRFIGILSVEPKGHCTVRFHAVREGEAWLDEEIEDYKHEAVAEFEL